VDLAIPTNPEQPLHPRNERDDPAAKLLQELRQKYREPREMTFGQIRTVKLHKSARFQQER
jgi:hypothetical protein